MSAQAQTLREALYYDDTYLRDDKHPGSTGECSLFVRRFRLRFTPKGSPRVDITRDVWGFPNDDAMLDAIEEFGMQGLPPEADDDRLYLPEPFDLAGVKAKHAPGRIKRELPGGVRPNVQAATGEDQT